MPQTYPKIERAQGGKRKTRRDGAKGRREDSLALLWAALSGEARPAWPSRSAKGETSRERTRRETPVAKRQGTPRSVTASNTANRPPVVASTALQVATHEVTSTGQGAETISAIQNSTFEQKSFAAGNTVQRENEVRDETTRAPSRDVIDREVSAERGEYPYQEWFVGEVQQPSFEMVFEPPQEVPSDTSQPDQLRGELRAELQELLRGQMARAAEERASAAHAMSRARVASYR